MFSATDFCQEIHGLFTDRAARNGIDFSFHTEVDACRVWIDMEKIEAVFFNLSYFSKCFKAEFGLTPKDYQQQTGKHTIDIEKELDINIQT